MKKISLIISAILLFSTLSLESSAAKLDETFTENSTLIEISTEASVKASPDIAMISAGVETEKPTAEAAFTENSNKMKRIFDALKAAGIEDKDIRTSNISLYPYREYNKNLEKDYIAGYRASNNLSVRFRDMKAVGKVIDALISQGANNLDGPTFSIENTDELLGKARIEAMKKAMDRAKSYADTANLKVKRIVKISENARNIRPMRHMLMKSMAVETFAAGDAAPTPIASGEEEMSVSINVEFELTK